ncbi:MAG TPA: DUF3089 domain-containing protein [Caulobacteraceae bacterium]|nr:DUF3089 domain-containing protein [Caulobacteraceae bacterium]
MAQARTWRILLGGVAALLVALAVAALLIWRDDILQALLDPKVPYSVYRPPPAPDYARTSAWILPKADPPAALPPADVFFVHPTTFDGGKDWNGAIGDRKANAELVRVMLPNYAAPFARAGRVIVPHYRQASLYTSLTLWVDAIEARQFAYGDVRDAFRWYLDHMSGGRPFFIVGVEQGGGLAARLLRDEIAPDPALRARLVGAYLIDTVVPADEYGPGSAIPACDRRDQAHCVLAWMSVRRGDFTLAQRILSRSVVWDANGRLDNLGDRLPLCGNPLLGATTDVEAPARLNLGAANATGLEWGARPAWLVRQVGAQCEQGLLRVTAPSSDSLKPSGDWAERHKAPGFNLFWADLQADSLARLAAFQAGERAVSPPR